MARRIVQATGSFTPALLVAAAMGISSALVYLVVVRRPVVLDLADAPTRAVPKQA